MATTQIDALLQLRRGTNAERQTTLLSAGEVSYVTDIKRVYVGDDVTLGGNVVGNNIYSSTTPSYSAVKYDLFFKTNTSVLYMLSSDAGPDNLANYARLTPNTDGTTIVFTNGVFSINPAYVYGSSGFMQLTGGTVNGSITLLSTLSVAQSGSFGGILDLNNNRIINLGNAVLSSDAINLLTLTSQITSLSVNLVNIFNTLIISLSDNTNTDYLRKIGDVMTGSLTIRSSLSVTGDIKTNSDVVAFA